MTFIFGPHTKCEILQPVLLNKPYHIFGHNKLQKFKYDDYLAILSSFLLSYVVEVDA